MQKHPRKQGVFSGGYAEHEQKRTNIAEDACGSSFLISSSSPRHENHRTPALRFLLALNAAEGGGARRCAQGAARYAVRRVPPCARDLRYTFLCGRARAASERAVAP